MKRTELTAEEKLLCAVFGTAPDELPKRITYAEIIEAGKMTAAIAKQYFAGCYDRKIRDRQDRMNKMFGLDAPDIIRINEARMLMDAIEVKIHKLPVFCGMLDVIPDTHEEVMKVVDMFDRMFTAKYERDECNCGGRCEGEEPDEPMYCEYCGFLRVKEFDKDEQNQQG